MDETRIHPRLNQKNNHTMENHILHLAEQEIDLIYHALEYYPAHLVKGKEKSECFRELKRKITNLPTLEAQG